MWRSFWRSIDRFSLQHFKYVIEELRRIKVVDKHNGELVIDLLQSVVEIVTYGDRQDPLIFECFMEHQVLAEVVRILKISRNLKIEAAVLQYLSIMIQNMNSEHAIYYCFSNEYINNIILHQHGFEGGDLAPYYVSFLRAVSGKVNRDTLCLLVKVHGDAVVSFPLYTEALKFACDGEKMIQTAVRAITLNIYNVSDDMVYEYITTQPVSEYFSNLVHRLKDLCFHLDTAVHATEEMGSQQRRLEINLESNKIVDELYYFKDILSVGEIRLSNLVEENLLNILVFPILLPLQQSKNINATGLSALTSLYVVSRLLQVVGAKCIINNVASALLYPLLSSHVKYHGDGNASDEFDQELLKKEGEMIPSITEPGKAENIQKNDLFEQLADFMSSNSNIANSVHKVCFERKGILAYTLSENHILLLASLFLLLNVAESKDLDCLLVPTIGLHGVQNTSIYENSSSQVGDGNILTRLMPEILNALLKALALQPPLSVMMQWQTGWFLHNLLIIQRNKLTDENLFLFNTSYEGSCRSIRKELYGVWFDYIPVTLTNEWRSCKRALEESSQHKDPLFMLELALQQHSHGEATSDFAWQRMVDSVKVFILHLHLKTLLLKGELAKTPSVNVISSPTIDSRTSHSSDVSYASFGSDVSLVSGIPCKIAFSKAGISDVYLIPVASGAAGKLLLMEKHPFRSRRGVVIAVAPLAGLCPKIDENHPSWLCLRIRDYEPRLDPRKGREKHSKMSNHMEDGRWTLGFENAKACEDALSMILAEISKQRSSVEKILAALLQNDFHVAR